MIALVAIGAIVVLLVLVDVTDLLLVRSGKRSVFRFSRKAIPTGSVFGPTSAAGTDRPARNANDLTG